MRVQFNLRGPKKNAALGAMLTFVGIPYAFGKLDHGCVLVMRKPRLRL